MGKKSRILLEKDYGGSAQSRTIIIRKETYHFKDGRKEHRVVARVGKGFSKKFYKTAPRGSVLTWTRYKPSFIRTLRPSQEVYDKAKLNLDTRLLRRSLRTRAGKLSAVKDVSGKDSDKVDMVRVREKIVEVRTSDRLSHPGRVGGLFTVWYEDATGKVRRRDDVLGLSERSVRHIRQLSQSEISRFMEQAARMAAKRVMIDEMRTSADVLDVVPTSRPFFMYDIDRKTGVYSKAYDKKTVRGEEVRTLRRSNRGVGHSSKQKRLFEMRSHSRKLSRTRGRTRERSDTRYDRRENLSRRRSIRSRQRFK